MDVTNNSTSTHTNTHTQTHTLVHTDVSIQSMYNMRPCGNDKAVILVCMFVGECECAMTHRIRVMMIMIC